MKYFVKVSWQDRNQPLCREHANDVVDITPEEFDQLVMEVKNQVLGRWTNETGFTVDFMMPVPLYEKE